MQQQPFNLKALMEKSVSDHQREQSIYRVSIAGSLINMFLLVFKFTAGILGVSAATIADLYRAAIHERNGHRHNREYISKIGSVISQWKCRKVNVFFAKTANIQKV